MIFCAVRSKKQNFIPSNKINNPVLIYIMMFIFQFKTNDNLIHLLHLFQISSLFFIKTEKYSNKCNKNCSINKILL